MSISRIDTLYVRIFEVKVQHNYYLKRYEYSGGGAPIVDAAGDDELMQQYDIRNDLSFVPTAATAEFMRRSKMLMKTTPLGFFVGMPVTEDAGEYKPLRKLDPDFVLQFEIHSKNPQFFNFSSLPLDGLGEDVVTTGTTTQYFRKYYYFKNRKNKFPYLNMNSPLRESAINLTNDVESAQNKPIRPQAFGLIELTAVAGTNSDATIFEDDVLNISNISGTMTGPIFELEIESRKLYWFYIDKDGAFADRSRHRLFLTKIQTNPIKIDGGSGTEDRQNPSPQNIKWDTTLGEYVAEVYSGY